MLLRTIFHTLRARRRSPLGIHDVGRMPLRVYPADIDTLRHVNNGVYLSYMDLGRLDLLVRAGMWKKLVALGIYPVVSSETITFRRSLQTWQPFELATRVIGYDERAVYIEQRFVVDGEIVASGVVRGRFLRRSGGTVLVSELAEALGIDTAEVTLPEWVERWAADVALPPARGSAPNDW